MTTIFINYIYFYDIFIYYLRYFVTNAILYQTEIDDVRWKIFFVHSPAMNAAACKQIDTRILVWN